MKILAFILFCSLLGLNHTKAMSQSDNHISQPILDSLYKIWKFKKAELIEDPRGALRTVNIENYDLWDLTKKDTLSYSIKDSTVVTHSIAYKMVNNAMILQFPNNKNNVAVQFKISELTSDRLKVTLHVSYTIKDVNYTPKDKIKDEDIIELIFEAERK